ncbi:hypothetical protein MKX01_002718 [Papaver californicum]|nr:hypothetical protein MKX01_002718 [Papaver californicum]
MDVEAKKKKLVSVKRKRSLLEVENSFAQTVETLFALSFLVKEGRAEMKVDDDGHHMFSLRNVQYKHFVFRIDYKDWSTMRDLVAAGNEVMPHRNSANPESAPHGG